MTRLVPIAMLCHLLPLLAQAAAPPAVAPPSATAPAVAAAPTAAAPTTAARDGCLMLNNRILGPRTQNRPLPLLAGNESQGFRHACSVAWTTLSPRNEPLAVEACFRGNLLQIANDSACGKQTGPLWVGARWVVTSADLMQSTSRLAMCQQLETGAWAGTRDFSLECAARDASPAATAKSGTSVKTPDRTTPTSPGPPPAPHN